MKNSFRNTNQILIRAFHKYFYNMSFKLSVLIVCCCFIASCGIGIDAGPMLNLSDAEDITTNSATLIASITTNDSPLLVYFNLIENGKSLIIVTDSCPPNHTAIIKKTVFNLKPDTEYEYQAIACKNTEKEIVVVKSNETKKFSTKKPSITIKEIKSDFSSIRVKIDFVPYEANTKVQLEYTVNGNTLTKLSEAYSTATELNFTLDNLAKNTFYPIKIKTIDKYNTLIDTTFNTCAVSDYNGNAYRIIKIGDQTWLQENFRGTHFTNGDAIVNITDIEAWRLMEITKAPAYCWYNNDLEIGKIYGGLYNWYTANDSFKRKLIQGYRTPSQSDFNKLSNYLGGEKVAGVKMREAGYTHWIKPGYHIVGQEYLAANTSGFCGLPGGERRENDFESLGRKGQFWTSNTLADNPNVVFFVNLWGGDNELTFYGGVNWGFVGSSIRLIKK